MHTGRHSTEYGMLRMQSYNIYSDFMPDLYKKYFPALRKQQEWAEDPCRQARPGIEAQAHGKACHYG